jgi:hypothetical protein
MDQPTSHPPTESLDRARHLLSAEFTERNRRIEARRQELARIDRQRRDLILEPLRPHQAALMRLAEATRDLLGTRERHVARRKAVQLAGTRDARVTLPSGLVIQTPPFDFAWTSGSGQGSEAADAGNASYSLAVQSFGEGSRNVAAGVGYWFFSGTGGTPLPFTDQRMWLFNAVCDYADDWWDGAEGYVAHNSGTTRLWVFGAAEQDWVARSDQTPSWSDGVGWFESHRNGGEDGSINNAMMFLARPNSWYQCWVWSAASVYADGGVFGIADSSIHMDIRVPLSVVRPF